MMEKSGSFRGRVEVRSKAVPVYPQVQSLSLFENYHRSNLKAGVKTTPGFSSRHALIYVELNDEPRPKIIRGPWKMPGMTSAQGNGSMSRSETDDHNTGFGLLGGFVEVTGVRHEPGWLVLEIRIPWATGRPELNGGTQPDCKNAQEPERHLYSPEDVARILNVSVRAVEQLVRKKKLGCIQLTKRKRAFTQELIDDFIRRESGLSHAMKQSNGKPTPLGERPAFKPMPIEDARSLLKKVMKTT